MTKKYILVLTAFLCVLSSSFGQIVNGDFESWSGTTPNGWTTIESGITTSEETTIVYGGSSSANINVTTATQGNTDFRQTVTLVNGDNYTVSVWIRHTEGNMRARLYIDGYLGYSTPTNTTTWQEITHTFTATSNSAEMGLRFYDVSGFDGAEIVYVDDFTLTNNSVPTNPTVTYNGNGNTGGTAPTDANNPYTSGDTVTVLGNTGSLTRTCSTFNGWNTSADGTGIAYSSGNTFTITTSTTLYAQWTPTGNTVTFNSNGGSGSMPDQINCVSSNLNNNTFTYTGFTFNSWNTAPDGSGTTYVDGALYNFTADITLYAQWDVFVGPCLTTGFEDADGWSNYAGGNWTNTTVDGDYISNGCYASTGSANGGSRKIGLNDFGDWLELPTVDNPASLEYYARLSSAPSGTNSISTQYFNGSSWVDLDVYVSTSTTYELITVDLSSITALSNVRLRLYRSADNRTQYVDDVSVFCGIPCSVPVNTAAFNASNNNCNTIDLNWDLPSCAEEVMIVAREGSVVSSTPTGDGSAYSANSIFGIGTDIGTNEYVVYKGLDLSTSITDLNNLDTYYFTIFSRVGSNWSSGISSSSTVNYTVADVNTFTTFNNCGVIDLNWTLPSCFDEVLIIAKNGSVVTASPSGNGSLYTANSAFGTGGSGTNLPANEFAVYKGMGSNVSITGLTNGNTYYFEIFVRIDTSWSSGISTSAVSSISGSGPTTFNPGDLVFIGFDSYVNGPFDKYSILSLVDIGPNTEFIIANLLYEYNDAASVSSGKWYNCATQFDTDPPFAAIQYTGCSDIPKGSVICIETDGLGEITSITINGITATSSFTINSTNFTAGNISTSNPDAMWLMQGTFSSVQTEADGPDNGTTVDRYRTFTGTVFGGLQTKGYFQDASNTGNNGGLRVSRIHPDIECLYLETGPTSDTRFFGFYYGATTGSQYQLLSNVTDITNFWDVQSGSGGIQNSDNISFTCSNSFNVTSNDAIAGQWMGNISTDWFDCHNWQNFTVPDNTIDVNINSTSIRNCEIDNTSVFAPKYNYIADCNNIIVTNRSLIIDSNNDVLNIFGDFELDNSGLLDMNDGNNGTDDGVINLYGNWINNVGINAFDEGNGTVAFRGTTTQSILFPPPLPPNQTEEFYNVILDNDFNTGISNNLHANGNLDINASRTLTVPDGNYVYTNFNVTNNGTFNIENNGSLVQGDDSGVNFGNISVKRNASIRRLDYVYWSSPVEGFSVDNVYGATTPTNRIYRWNTTVTNPNGGQGNWVSAAGETMLEGIGYIVRGPDSYSSTIANITATFDTGKAHNGVVSLNVSRGSNIGSEDDDWNLIGNPYPSSINAIDFLTHSTNSSSIEGFINIWTHGNLPSDATTDPFYDDFGYNYTESDYITYNDMGSSSGPSTFNGYIASGQAFMVNTVNGSASTTLPVLFNNNMRNKSYDNSEFFRVTENRSTENRSFDKHRIWLDFVSNDQSTNRILVGFADGATDGRDRMYDAISDNQSFYSLIGNKSFAIQGRGLPFNDNDIIPVGLKINSGGSHYIAIAEIDGMFETENQIIYLKDNESGYIHNLVEAPYSFNSDAGTFNNRFEIVFRPNTLSVDEHISNTNSLKIIELDNNNVMFKLDSSNVTITDVEIINLLGKTVYKFKGSSNTETFNLSNLSSSTYIAKVTLSNGQTITKKGVKK